jgi:hypothetical protein
MFRRIQSWAIVGFAVAVMAVWTACALACPFCSAVPLTFAQEIKAADAAVIAELVDVPAHPAGIDGGFAPGIADSIAKSKFRIVEVLKGADLLKHTKQVETFYLGDAKPGTQFMISAIDPKSLSWSTPVPLSKRGHEYLAAIIKFPETGPERLAFFQNYLEDDDEVLRGDAYGEFAQASYADVKAFGPQVNYTQLIGWLKNPEISPSHRRLYFTLLGVCGTEKDIPLLETIFHSQDRKLKSGLDAMIGSYLAIKGPTGLRLVEDLYLKNKDAEFTDTYAAIQAIRIAEETGIIAKDKAAESFHSMLDRPKMADLVIPDLARWQDWSVLDRMSDLFTLPGDEATWVRVPVLRYLKVCPLPEAKKMYDRLALIDPTAAKQAESFLSLPGGLGAPAPAEQQQSPANSGATKQSTAPAPSSTIKTSVANTSKTSGKGK